MTTIDTPPTELIPIPAAMPNAGASAHLNFGELERLAKTVAASGLFPGIRTQEQALTLMMLCEAEGLHPIQAMRRYHLIQNRPTMRADAMLASFQTAGGRVQWHDRTDQRVSATFSHPSGGSAQITWDLDQARRAGLATKDIWQQYPRQMLTARVISEGVRTVLPGVVVGIYTPEEVADFGPMLDVTPRQPEPKPEPKPEPEPEPKPATKPKTKSAPTWSALEARARDRFAAIFPDEATDARARRLDQLCRDVITAAVAEGKIGKSSVVRTNSEGQVVPNPKSYPDALARLARTERAWLTALLKEYFEDIEAAASEDKPGWKSVPPGATEADIEELAHP